VQFLATCPLTTRVSTAALREIYLMPFLLAQKYSKPWSVMTSYNRLNGVHCMWNGGASDFGHCFADVLAQALRTSGSYKKCFVKSGVSMV
jgi:hypothetical protein